jgi:hypothetical protein
VESSLLIRKECTSGLTYDASPNVTPSDVGWVLLGEDPDLVAIHHDAVFPLLHREWEASMSGVVTELVDHVVDGHVGVVDVYDFHGLLFLEHGPEDESSNTTETVDT